MERIAALSELEQSLLAGLDSYQRVVAIVPEVGAGGEALSALATYLILLGQLRQQELAAYAATLTPG